MSQAYLIWVNGGFLSGWSNKGCTTALPPSTLISEFYTLEEAVRVAKKFGGHVVGSALSYEDRIIIGYLMQQPDRESRSRLGRVYRPHHKRKQKGKDD